MEGTVEFDANGEPTGTLRDQAAADIIAAIPDPLATLERKKDAVEKACHELNSHGLTGVHAIQESTVTCRNIRMCTRLWQMTSA